MDVLLQAMAPKKLLTKRAWKDAAGEWCSAAPQVDIEFGGHRFWSEEHRRHYEAINGWSFLKERWVQLREGEYTEFQEKVAKTQWTQLTGPMAKYDSEIVMDDAILPRKGIG